MRAVKIHTEEATFTGSASIGLTNWRYARMMSSLPARVRVSRLPLPIAPNVAAQLRRLLPAVTLNTVTRAAAALAGGRVLGALVLAQEGQVQSIESGWRGRGIEQALIDALQQGATPQQDTAERQEAGQQ